MSAAGPALRLEMRQEVPCTFCIMCTHLIPEEREVRGSNTCSKECKKAHKTLLAQKRRQRVCRYCGNPTRKRRVNKPWNQVPHTTENSPQ